MQHLLPSECSQAGEGASGGHRNRNTVREEELREALQWAGAPGSWETRDVFNDSFPVPNTELLVNVE